MAILKPRPRSASPSRAAHALALALAGLLFSVCAARAETPSVSEEQVKAAFVYNFAKFIEWPTGTFKDASEPIVVGIVGEGRFGDILDETLRGKLVQGRPMTVKHFPDARVERCQILVVADERSTEVLSRLGTTATLTVGDGSDFTRSGGMIGFAVEERRVRFDVNLEALRRAQLKPSSQLLKVARVVEGSPAQEGAP